MLILQTKRLTIYHRSPRIMRKKYFRPYDVNLEYEMKTYKYIGKDYGDSENANKGVIFNLLRSHRKKKNKDQLKYAFCNTYSEWEKHVNNKINNILGKYKQKDFLHWVYQNRQRTQIEIDVVKTILIPIYIALLAGVNLLMPDLELEVGNINLEIVIVSAVVVFMSTYILYNSYEKVCFYNDFIKIIEEYLCEKSE